jgi:hypothetical protein
MKERRERILLER